MTHPEAARTAGDEVARAERRLRARRLLLGALSVGVGWLLFRPETFGIENLPAFVPAALVAIILFFVSTVLAISWNLPLDLSLAPAPDSAISEPLRRVSQTFEALGFRRAGPVWRVDLMPPAILVTHVDEEANIYGVAYETQSSPPKVVHECVSVFEGDRGGLLTTSEVAGTVLPPGRGGLRQVIAGAPAADLVARHRAALAQLRARGIGSRRVSAEALPLDLKNSLRRQREAFLAAPIRNTLVVLWRTVTRTSPDRGPIEEQSGAQRQIENLLIGRSG